MGGGGSCGTVTRGIYYTIIRSGTAARAPPPAVTLVFSHGGFTEDMTHMMETDHPKIHYVFIKYHLF